MARKNRDSGLTDQQKLFCQEYLVDLNSKQAAIRAKYSPKTAEQQGSRLLSNVKVARYLKRLMEKHVARVDVKPDEVLAGLLKLARVDVGQIFDADGGLLPVKEMPAEVRYAIAAIEMKDGVPHKLRFYAKDRALELLGKYLRLFAEKIEVSGRVTLEQLVLGAVQETKETPNG